MKQQDYHRAITAKISPEDASEKIGRVSDWWTKKGFSGHSQELGDNDRRKDALLAA